MKRIAIIAALTSNSTAYAITVHRVTSLADHGPGTLRAAVTSATNGDRVTFAPWLFQKIIRLNSEININKQLRIEGDINGDRRPDITLDGQHSNRLLKVAPAGNVSLWAIALEHGKANNGGAIYNRGTINAQFCKISENKASSMGGGIYNRGTITIDHSSMRDNTANRGGAIYTAKLENGTNTTPPDAAKTTLVASTFAWNRAMEHGGAIYNYGGKFKAFMSTFANNRAQPGNDWEHNKNAKGSVLYAYGGTNEITDSTLKNNKSAPNADPELNECSFGVGKNRCSGCSCRPDDERKRNNKNRRVNNGGTLYNHGLQNNPQPIKITRTVISESRGRNCGGWGTYTLEHSWIDDDSCNGDADYSEPGSSWGDAKLGLLADNGGYTYTYKPLTGSGLIDAAGSTCLNTDQRGARRTEFRDPKCDIGAVETNAHPPSRLRPQTINTTPPTEHREDLATLHETIRTQQANISAKAETITTQQADISAKAETITAQQANIEAKTETITAQQADIEAKTTLIRAQEIEIAQLHTLETQLATIRYHIGKKDRQITQLQQQAAVLEQEITEHKARITEREREIEALGAPDELEATIGDAGEIKRLVLNGQNILHDSETTVKIGPTTQRLKNTITAHIHDRKDGRTVSAGELWGQNGIIHWEITSSTIPRTNWHVNTWTFSSAQAFGDVALGIYADIDIQPYTGFNGLIAGGQNHPNRLLITDRENPSEGIALGVRALKNARLLGWVGSPDIYHGRNGEILDESILTGAYSGWGSFRPDGGKYPGAAGYGPADIAVAIGIELKPSAKLASFEITLVGAPTGAIE